MLVSLVKRNCSLKRTKDNVVIIQSLSIRHRHSNLVHYRQFSSGRNDDGNTNGHKPSISSLSSLTKWAFEVVRGNLSQAVAELTGSSRESVLEKQLQQATTFKRRSPKSESDETEEQEDNTYTGTTELVHVKTPQSQWDQMKARLQSSPIFREILKNSKKISSAAANTDIGKKAQEVTNKVQDKIEDIREIWETSQNPLVYTLSGVWDSMTAETEEALTLTAIQKLDPNFSKVSFLVVFIILSDMSRSVGLKKSKPSLSH